MSEKTAKTKPDLEKVEYQLRGKTLQVYIHLLKTRRGVGVREVQRALGFSSPSLAYHHLEKLESLGLVVKDRYGRYVVARRVDVGILGLFINFLGLALPRYFFYASFFTTISLHQLLLTAGNLNLTALVVASLASIIFWYETVRIWRRRPF